MRLDTILDQAEKALNGFDFQSLDRDVDRYGSREWTWIRAEGSGNRYVTLALTASVKSPTRFEIWAGADDGQNWVRQSVYRWEEKSAEDLRTSFADEIFSLVTDAAKTALAFHKEDLTNSYPRITTDGDGRTHAAL